MRFLLSFLVSTVLATESLLVPWQQNVGALVTQPEVSFGQLHAGAAPEDVLGISTSDDTPDDQDMSTPSSAQQLYFTVEISPTPTPQPTPTQSGPTATPSVKLRKSSFTIALLGDSMIDTLGPGIPDLSNILATVYPGTTFRLLNYGVGASNILYGLRRLTGEYEYLGRSIPSLISQSPDIVVIESLGYNPLPPEEGDINTHWMTLARMVDVIQDQLPSASIVIAATIAPNSDIFGDGAPGLSYTSQGRAEHTQRIRQYLEGAIAFAKTKKLPLADVYHASTDRTGNGKPEFINAGDHIHYSDVGRTLFAQTIFNAIEQHKLLY